MVGPAPRALDCFAYAIGLFILWTGWLVLRRFLERPAALLGLAVLAVPPLFLAQWSFTAIPNHPAALAVGNLCLLATHTIFVADPGRPRALLGLGLLAGLGWWLDPFIVDLPCAVRDPGAPDRPRVAMAHRLVRRRAPRRRPAPVAVRDGKLPVGEVRLAPGGRRHRGAVPRTAGGSRGGLPPRLLGLHLPAGRPGSSRSSRSRCRSGPPRSWEPPIRDRAQLAWLVGGRGPIGRGQIILWIVAVTNLGAGADLAARDRPLLPAPALLRAPVLDGRVPRLAAPAAAPRSPAPRWPHCSRSTRGPTGRTASLTTDPGAPRWTTLTRRVDPALRWLEDHGVRGAYLAGRFTSRPTA